MSKHDTHAKLEAAADAIRKGRLEQAMTIYGEVAQSHPDCAAAWFGLGTINARIGKSQDAILMLERAMAISGPLPEYHHNMGAAKASLGRFAEADAHFREAIRMRPEDVDSYYSLAAIHRFTTEDGFHLQIEDLLKNKRRSNGDLVLLHFTAGKVYDDLGDYDRAFEHYRLGNECREVDFDRARYENLLKRSRELFDATNLADMAKRGHRDRRFVFVVGMPRSGTTLVEQILSSHSKVYGAGELPHIALVARDLTKHSASGAAYPDAVNDVPDDALGGFGAWYAGATNGLDSGITLFIDKNPNNFRYLGLINAMLPEAKIIHCRRDPLDTCLSCYFMNFHKEGEYSFDFGDLAAYYGGYHHFMEHWRDVLTVPMFEVDYESLVSKPKASIRQIIDFLDLDWEPGLMAFNQTHRAVQTASKWQVRQPIYAHSVQRWRNYERHIEPLADALRGHGVACGGTQSGDTA